MKATALEYRFRLFLVFALVLLGVWSFGVQSPTVWMLLSGWLAHHHWLGIQYASLAIGYAAALMALIGALLRTWGSAYISARVVAASGIHAQQLITAGPFRFTRNPLYVGTEISFFGLAILMPLYGAIFLLIAAPLFFLRLALAEEARLTELPGYRDYATRVARFLPSLRGVRESRPRLRPRWGQAVLGEIYYWGAAASFFIFVPQFNALRIWQGVGVSFGVSLIVKALWPRQLADPA